MKGLFGLTFIFALFQFSNMGFSQTIQWKWDNLKRLTLEDPEGYSNEFLALEERFKNDGNNAELYELYNVHFKYLFNVDLYDSANAILKQQYLLIGNKKGEEVIPLYLNFALTSYFQSNFDSLNYWINKSKVFIDTDSPFYSRYLLVSGYKNVFDAQYRDAIEITLESIEYSESRENLEDLILAYKALAYYYGKLGEYEIQNKYLLKAVDLISQTGNQYELISTYNNLGVNYKDLRLWREALTYYDLAYEELKNYTRFRKLLAQNLTNRANIHEKLGEYDEAEELFLQCEQVCKENEIIYGVMLSNLNLGNLYRLQKKYKSAEKRLNEALRLSKDLNTRKEESLVLERLSWLAKDQLLYEKAYKYQSLFINLKDSLLNERVKIEAKELDQKYEFERQQNQIILLSKAKLKQRFIIVILVIGILCFLFFFMWRNKRSELILSEKERERQEIEKRQLTDSIKKVSVMYTKESILRDIKEITDELPKNHRSKFNSIMKELNSTNDESIIQEFETRFLGVHDDFFKKLQERAPDLTPTELRTAALIRLNFTSKEIATITNRTVGTIDNLRSSIRKKMLLKEEENLIQKLIEI